MMTADEDMQRVAALARIEFYAECGDMKAIRSVLADFNDWLANDYETSGCEPLQISAKERRERAIKLRELNRA